MDWLAHCILRAFQIVKKLFSSEWLQVNSTQCWQQHLTLLFGYSTSIQGGSGNERTSTVAFEEEVTFFLTSQVSRLKQLEGQSTTIPSVSQPAGKYYCSSEGKGCYYSGPLATSFIFTSSMKNKLWTILTSFFFLSLSIMIQLIPVNHLCLNSREQLQPLPSFGKW